MQARLNLNPTLLSFAQNTLAVSTPKVDAQYLANLRVGHRLENSSVELFFAAKNIVGWFRDREDTRQFAGSAVDPIGGSLLLGLAVHK